MTLLLLVLAGAAGSALRYAASRALDRPLATGWPRGTLLVNLAGSLLLGGLAAVASPAVLAVAGVGLCGGLTTYSAFAVQVADGGARRGAAYAGVTLVGCVCAAGLGWLASCAWLAS